MTATLAAIALLVIEEKARSLSSRSWTRGFDAALVVTLVDHDSTCLGRSLSTGSYVTLTGNFLVFVSRSQSQTQSDSEFLVSERAAISVGFQTLATGQRLN